MNEFLEKHWPMLIVAVLFGLTISMAGKLTSSNLPGKGLQFKKVSKVALGVTEDDAVQSDIGLTVDGAPVSNPYLTTLVLKNTGNIPISKDDYDVPISIVVQNEPTIILMRYEHIPEEMHTKVTHTDKELLIAPTLMNPSDMVVIEVFTQGGMPDFEIEGHIEGIRKIYTEEGWQDRRWSKSTGLDFFFFFLTVCSVMFFALILHLNYQSKYVFISRRAGGALFITLCAISVYTFFDFIEDHARPFYTSTSLLLGCFIIALLLAWVGLRSIERN